MLSFWTGQDFNDVSGIQQFPQAFRNKEHSDKWGKKYLDENNVNENAVF